MGQKLFIGGLAFSTGTERLREAFEAAGQVESAAVVTDRETGCSRRELVRTVSGLEQADTEFPESACARIQHWCRNYRPHLQFLAV
jgi:hypothetical protein